MSRPRLCDSFGNEVSSTRGARPCGWIELSALRSSALDLFGVQVLLEYGDLAAHPGFADGQVQRRHRVDHELLQALLHQRLGQMAAQFGQLVRLDQTQKYIQFARGSRAASAHAAQRGQVGQASAMILPGRCPRSISRLISGASGLAQRVDALSVGVAPRAAGSRSAAPTCAACPSTARCRARLR